MEKIESNKIGEKGMEFIDGRQVCRDCLLGNHDHSISENEIKLGRSDCKNTDRFDGEVYQCLCGTGGICRERKWEDFTE